jgi:hypothetical protein
MLNSLLFSQSFFINTEPIEPNLNSIYSNKYSKILRRTGIMSKTILVFQSFTDNCFCSFEFKPIQFFNFSFELSDKLGKDYQFL